MNFGVTNFYLEMSADSCSSQIQQMDEVLSFWVVFIHLLKPQHMQQARFLQQESQRENFLSFFIYLFS